MQLIQEVSCSNLVNTSSSIQGGRTIKNVTAQYVVNQQSSP